MKPSTPVLLIGLVSFTLAGALAAAEKPQAVLDAIAKIRTTRAEEAKAAGTRVDTAALQKEIVARAKSAMEGIDPAKIDLKEALEWQQVYLQAQDYKGAQAITRRWVEESTGSEKFNAQMALVTANVRASNYIDLGKTLLSAEPTDGAQRIRLATTANSYLDKIAAAEGGETALKVLTMAEKTLPTEGFTNDREAEYVKRARESLVKSRKTIEQNPGKEAEALAAERRTSLAGLLAARNRTNAAASREERDAKLAKMTGTAATNFKADHTIGDFKSLSDLKGKVVMLDFFAHWCGPCIASFPSVRALYDDLKPQGLEVVGVTRYYGYYKTEGRAKKDMTPETERERMKDFVTEKRMNWPVAFVDSKVFSDYQCSAIPHVVLIDKKGKIQKVKVGYNTNEVASFRATVEKLLKE